LAVEGQGSIRAWHDRRAPVVEGNVSRTDKQSTRAKRGEPHAHLIAADTRVYDLA
jgi:hypothetical protein